MTYLVTQLLVHLLIALAIGLFIGWMYWGRGRETVVHATPAAGASSGADALAAAEARHAETVRQIRAAHVQELTAARAIMEHAPVADGASLAELRAAHAKELASARAIIAEFDKLERPDADAVAAFSDRLATMESSVRTAEAERDALRTEVADLRALLDAAEEMESETPVRAQAEGFAGLSVATGTAEIHTFANLDGAQQASEGEGSKPELFTAPPENGGDDLQRISGVGVKLEGVLNDLGVYTFAQIAAWSEDEVRWVDEHLKFKGRIARERWIEQAKALVEGRDPAEV